MKPSATTARMSTVSMRRRWRSVSSMGMPSAYDAGRMRGRAMQQASAVHGRRLAQAHLLADLGHRGRRLGLEAVRAGLEDPVDLGRVGHQLARSARGPGRSAS